MSFTLFPHLKNKQKNVTAGFTLIEMMVVLGIISTISAIVLSRYPDSADKTKLSNITGDLSGDIREAQLKASSVDTYGQTISGFGMQFASNSNNLYKQYADRVTGLEKNGIFLGNRVYDGAVENFKTVTLPDGYHISNTCVSTTSISRPFTYCSKNGNFNDLSIEYERPNPEPWIFVNNSTSTLYASACMELSSDKFDNLSHKNGYARSILVVRTGLISGGLGKCTQDSLVLLATPGVCAGPHYTCLTGNSSSPVNGVNTWSWQCDGLNGGAPASCTESKSYSQTFPTSGVSGVNPSGIVTDLSGNIYTSNYGPSDITKITPAGAGSVFSTLTVASLPQAITIDEARGSLYTADYAGKAISKVNLATGVPVSPYYTLPDKPTSIAVDSLGNIYVTTFTQGKVYKISSAGVLLASYFLGSGLISVATDQANNAYVANYSAMTVTKIDSSGIISLLATLNVSPNGITTDLFGNIFTVNPSNNSITKIDSVGNVTPNFGGAGATGNNPRSITTDSSGNIFTANSSSNTVTKISSVGVATLNYGDTGSGPESITTDISGNVYTANNGLNNVTKIIVH